MNIITYRLLISDCDYCKHDHLDLLMVLNINPTLYKPIINFYSLFK